MQIKKTTSRKRREASEMEGRNYVDYVEAEFMKQMKERMRFEQKYLKIDKDSEDSYKQEHLNYLKGQDDFRASLLGRKA